MRGNNRSSFSRGSNSNSSGPSRFGGAGRSGGSRFGGGRPSGGRSFGGGRGGYGRGRVQPTFDPTDVVLHSQYQQQQAKPVEETSYKPVNTFADFAIETVLKEAIIARGYNEPTPIQDQTIPLILEGRDVVGIANTGTGKTAAFLLPLINKVLLDFNQKVLIVVPTRELALQVRDELISFSPRMDIYSALCIGGASMFRQVEMLRRHPQFVIGTPGRLQDLYQQRKLNFNEFQSIVLDEVDRMLDMGFVRDVQNIIDSLPEKRHSLFFSATMNSRVSDIMRGFLNNPVTVTIKSASTSININQTVMRIKGRNKIDVLHELLQTEGFDKVLVFGQTKHGANSIAEKLQDRGLKVSAIHGNKSQSQRQKALKEFRDNRLQALVATDVISRGLDIDDVTHVINYDLPQSYEDYIHRIGRTGRANKVGVAVTFVE